MKMTLWLSWLLCAAAMTAGQKPPAKGVVEVLYSHPTPVIDRGTAKAAGIQGGFETGNVVLVHGRYHLFYGEKQSPTNYPWKMGWTNQIGHWVSSDGVEWSRLETVMAGASLWSTMPFYDEADEKWKVFYCNESVGDTRTAVASVEGIDAIETPQTWIYPECASSNCPASAHPSINTYSISNPFQTAGTGDNWTVFLDHGGLFEVRLATGPKKAGPFDLLPDVTLLYPPSPPIDKNNSGGNHTWIENPVVTKTSTGKWVALWDYVQGGGQEFGVELPYFGFSWSDDGVNWPDTQGELFSVLPPHAKPGSVWTDLVRTPTSLIEEADGTFTFFYAARDTRGFEPPYVNCSVPPKPPPHVMLDGTVGGPPPPPPGWTDGCFWGIGKMTVRLNFPQ